ncbi:DUF1802 family protein [Geitlerinema sp. PCC 7407]|uniref:DUF1802 family protein n=1 Tax=Geitlerinema sp. PCC 7407 TaxID=1173025 RepID=UPI00029FFA5B|nr:DUF1802 family protein [Geitlerinema sp. PCC 7407]AFY65746.1 protein of unknown function DUF1802 [Geitlerinema sp. PCC 7407]
MLQPALKEWAVTVEALAAGNTILLLRKGGIQEETGSFALQHQQFWLYPTYEHQKPELLKPDYAAQVQPVPSGWHPETVEIQAWAEVQGQFTFHDQATLAAVTPFHVGNDRFAAERLRWKARSPLQGLILRVYRLPRPESLPYKSEYGGCRSWLTLPLTAEMARSHPALSDEAFEQQAAQLQQALQSVAPA